MKEKLEAKHLHPYLPYSLKVMTDEHEEFCMQSINSDGSFYANFYGTLNLINIHISKTKPILRPITSITNEEMVELLRRLMGEHLSNYINVTGMAEYENMMVIFCETNAFNNIVVQIDTNTGGVCLEALDCNRGRTPLAVRYEACQFLFSKHFDIFNLIKRGLAIKKQL